MKTNGHLLLERTPRIMVNFMAAMKTHREIQQGILEYARTYGHWAIRMFDGRIDDPDIANISLDEYSGYIGVITDSKILSKLRQKRIAAVILSDTPHARILNPRHTSFLICDNESLARAAAQELLTRGLNSFVYVGNAKRPLWSELRGESFAAHVRAAGYDCKILHPGPDLPLKFRDLARPIGIMISNDSLAREVLDACATAGIQFPRDANLISCDNDEITCETTLPTISSLQMDTFKAGKNAARLLDDLIHRRIRRPATRHAVTFGFEKLVHRQTTGDSRICENPLVQRIKTAIRLNASEPLTVAALAKSLKVSRRLMELRYRESTGSTIHTAIVNAKIDRAKDLIVRTNLPMGEIAAQCGFASPSHLSSVFRRLLGCRPLSLRKPNSHLSR